MPVTGRPAARGDVREFAVAAVAVEAVRPVVGDQQVGMAVVIEIADAGGLRPAGAREAGLLADFGEVALAIVAVELRVGRRRAGVNAVPLAMKMSLAPSPL